MGTGGTVSDIAIRADGLSKLYKIGALKQRHDTLRDQLVYGVKSLFSGSGRRSPAVESVLDGRSSRNHLGPQRFFFRNQAGRSRGFYRTQRCGEEALLKILSRITEPTSGRAEIYGRVESLLEVGTGFHPELTGRENVFLNGAILGMRRAEIRRKFDEIVAFAETEQFIDTPVKHYSSRMYVRLAFAVAAHLEPRFSSSMKCSRWAMPFQKKCWGKMGDIARQGRTVLFVSHNMAAVQGLCSRACLLSAGRIAGEGCP